MLKARGRLWSRMASLTRPFFRSEARWQAWGLLILIVLFIFALGGLNVLSNFMNRDFMTAVSEHDGDDATRLALLWAAVFGGLTVVGVFKAFAEDRLRLRWREWLSSHLISRYLSGRAYHRMKAHCEVDNPDQRITEDVKTFTDQSLALFLILTNSTITLLSFAGILWAITPWLFIAAVAYALFGSVMTVLLGRRLVKLDVKQYKKEADLRYDLMQVRAHAEPIALTGGEAEEGARLRRGLASVVENMKGIIGLSRNIAFCTTGYDWLIQLVPLLIVGPLYIRGEVAFGEVTQAQMAFMLVMGAFSVIVKEFQRISTFGAVVERLGTFCEALDAEMPGPKKPPIEIVESAGGLAIEGLTLVTPRDGRMLVKDLSVLVPCGGRLLVLGPSGSGRTALLRAASGLWASGQGRITRPPLADVAFLPQQPYLRPGTLRDQLLYGTSRQGLSDERLLETIDKVHFGAALKRVGGLDVEQDWPNTLSLGEQQQVAFARLLLRGPAFAFLDEATIALDEERAHRLYDALARTSAGYLSVASDPGLRRYHDQVIELGPGGTWSALTAPRAVSA